MLEEKEGFNHVTSNTHAFLLFCCFIHLYQSAFENLVTLLVLDMIHWTIFEQFHKERAFILFLFYFFMFCGPLCYVHFFPKYIHRFPPRESMVPSSMDRWEFHIALPAMSNEWSVDVIWKKHTVHLYTSYMVNFQGHWIIQHEIHGSSTISTAKKRCVWLILNFHLLAVNYLYGYRGRRYKLHKVFASKLLWKTREQKTITRRRNCYEL